MLSACLACPTALQVGAGLLLLLLVYVAWRWVTAGDAPIDSPLTVLIVGSGFSGICMALRLRKMGVRFRILEKDAGLGGTWYQNTYPGCACDIPSHLYSLSIASNPQWSSSYALQPEILRYLNDTADKYDIRRHIELDTAVTSATWNDDTRRWNVTLSSGEVVSANILVNGTGCLSEPRMPHFEGMDTFGGRAFHSAKWQADCPLDGKSVAIIGTGASSVQIVPSIAEKVSKLYVFQRTPCWILPKPEFPYPSSFKKLLTVLPLVRVLIRNLIFWIFEFLFFAIIRTNSILADKARSIMAWYHRSLVNDPDLAARLTPKYNPGCKRFTPTSCYLQSFNRNNVTLVTEKIKEITEKGLTTEQGTTIDADVIVYATGFDIRRSTLPYEIYRKAASSAGKEGVNAGALKNLGEQWGDEPCGFKGITCPGFPNLFFLLGPGTVLAHNTVLFMIECQVQYVVDAIKKMTEEKVESIEVKQDTLDEYMKWKADNLSNKSFAASGCTSWYRNVRGVNWTLWPNHLTDYWWKTRRVDLTNYHCQKY